MLSASHNCQVTEFVMNAQLPARIEDLIPTYVAVPTPPKFVDAIVTGRADVTGTPELVCSHAVESNVVIKLVWV